MNLVKATFQRKLKERPVMAPQVIASAMEAIADRLIYEAILGREPVEAARLLAEYSEGRPTQIRDELTVDNPYDALSDEELGKRRRLLMRSEAEEVVDVVKERKQIEQVLNEEDVF